MVILFQHLGLPEHARTLAKTINDFDPTLSLERLPEGHPWLEANPDKPYAVWHRSPAFEDYIIESYSEDRLDHRVLANLMFGDANRHDWNLEEFDPIAATHHLLEERRRAEINEENNLRMDYALRQRNGTGKRVL